MQLIAILLITVAVLTILSGLVVFCGATKGARARSAWFFVATIFAAVWTISIALFLVADKSWESTIAWHVNWTFVSAIFIDIALLGYISWRQTLGKILTIVFALLGLIISIVFVINPALLYSEVVIASTGNSLVVSMGPFYLVYIAFFCLLVPSVIVALLYNMFHSASHRIKGSDLVLLIGFGISGTASLIFNLILPFWTWRFVWLGPLTISTTIISFYYSILRYRALNLSSRWLKILSYVVLITSSAVLYIVIFDIIFAALFKGSSPSVEVIVLNFIMILIVLLLVPAMGELSAFVRSLISDRQIDLAYIVKRISRFSPEKSNLSELAAFLAEHMHFDYVGFVISGQVYGSAPRRFTADTIRRIEALGQPEDGIWQRLGGATTALRRQNISAVAALRNSDGQVYGQIVLGTASGKMALSRRDLAEVETVLNLVAAIITPATAKSAKASKITRSASATKGKV